MKRRILNAVLGRFQVLNRGQKIYNEDLELIEKNGENYKFKLNGKYAVKFLSLVVRF